MTEKRTTKVGVGDDIRDLAVEVPDGEHEIWGADAKLRVVGTHVPRVDGILKATGAAQYTADVNLPGMVHGRMLRSPCAAATLKSLDTSLAEKAPGVLLVLPVWPRPKAGTCPRLCRSPAPHTH